MNELPLAVDLLVALNLGLFSQVHCVGMCGGVVGALAFAVTPRALASRGMLAFALAYNGGRVASYAVAGALLAVVGQQGLLIVPGEQAHLVLRSIAGAMLVLAGSALLGGEAARLLERAGQRLWAVLRRPGQALLPLENLRGAWLFGMLWGWLPCAMVYAALLFAAASAGTAGAASAAALRGAVLMAAFGLSTSPALIAALFAATRAREGLARPAVRRTAGAFLVAVGLAYPFLGALFADHHVHHGGDGPPVAAPAVGARGPVAVHAHHHARDGASTR
ncbi:MAG: sulfite exporter TauE/SafE family protein [Gammaproteobacteria bacterium]